MSKKQAKERPPKKSKKEPARGKKAFPETGSKKLRITLGVLITSFALLLYAQSISHGYTLDDHKVIDQNRITMAGVAGIPTILTTDYWFGAGADELRGPIYRPTSLIIYAIVWQLSPDNTGLYHFVNVLSYALTCLVLFLVLCQLFKGSLLLPFICTFLYAAHPIHTEVVNNIKSLDEILCFLFGLLSIRSLLIYTSSQSRRTLISAGVFFYLSLTSKETGISFLLIIPLIILFFTDRFKQSIKPIGVLLVVVTVVWLIIRAAVFRDLDQNIVTATSALNNTLYAAPDISSRYATAFYILLRYLSLLIFPHPLSCDYNFATIEILAWNDPRAVCGLIIYALMGIYAIFNFRKKDVVTFGILFYLLTLAPVSNLFFLGGSSMAERFLFMPSLGFCIIAAYLILGIVKGKTVNVRLSNLQEFFVYNRTVLLLVFGIVFLYSFKSFLRSKDWTNTLTIFSHDIEVSPNSATANYLLGNSLILNAAVSANKQDRVDTFNLAKKYFKRSLEIAPGFFNASSNLGYVYLIENKADSACLVLIRVYT